MSVPQLTRLACDKCHQKKVRCRVKPESNRCIRCVDQNLSCVFSPPGRNGRPPRSSTTSESGDSRKNTQKKAAPSSASSSAPILDNTNPLTATSGAEKKTSLFWPPSDLSNALLPQSTIHHFSPGTFDSSQPILDDCRLASDTAETDHIDDLIFTPPAFEVHSTESYPKGPETDFLPNQPFPSDINTQVLTGEHCSPHETVNRLHLIQLEMHKNKIIITPSEELKMSPEKCNASFSNLFRLIEQVHNILDEYLQGAQGTGIDKQHCDLTTGISFMSVLAITIEVYETISWYTMSSHLLWLHHTMNGQLSFLSSPSNSSTSLLPQEGSCGYSTSASPDPGSLDIPSIPFDPSKRWSSPKANARESMIQMQIGNFAPCADLSRLILLTVLSFHIRTSRQIMNQMRGHFLNLQRSLFSSCSVNTDSPILGVGERTSSHRSVASILTPSSCFTLLQLCEDLLAHLSNLDQRVTENSIIGKSYDNKALIIR
jgi:hypothetical protein